MLLQRLLVVNDVERKHSNSRGCYLTALVLRRSSEREKRLGSRRQPVTLAVCITVLLCRDNYRPQLHRGLFRTPALSTRHNFPLCCIQHVSQPLDKATRLIKPISRGSSSEASEPPPRPLPSIIRPAGEVPHDGGSSGLTTVSAGAYRTAVATDSRIDLN